MPKRLSLTLQQKILLIIVGISVFLFSITIVFSSIQNRNAAVNNALQLLGSTAQVHTSEIHGILDANLFAVRTLATTVATHRTLPFSERQTALQTIYRDFIEHNPQNIAVWDSWEMNRVDSNYNLPYGRYVNEYFWDGTAIESQFTQKSLQGDSDNYARIKREKKEGLEDPFFSNRANQQLATSIVVPIVFNSEFWGAVGIDIPLKPFHSIINQVRPFGKGFSMLISHDFKYIAHPQKEQIGESILPDYETLFESNGVLTKMAEGTSAFYLGKDINGRSTYFSFSPIYVGESQNPWTLCLVVPRSAIVAQANKGLFYSLLVGLLGLLALSYITFSVLTKRLFRPIAAITSILQRVSDGEIDSGVQVVIESNDEMGHMAQALSNTVAGLEQKVNFANSIGSGNLNAPFELLGANDHLGKALVNMRQSLAKANEEAEKHRSEERIRQWINEGLASFSELLRENTSSIEELASSIVRELVQSVDANQGGLFLFTDEDSDNPHFFLASSYAYNRRKFITKTILPAEGLIGACATEKKSIHLTEIPEDYLEISSGLGEAKPKNLLITPLILENNVLGVFELASFNAFKEHQIDFVERVATSCASAITSVRINIRTTQLLFRTQQQAEEMQAQEEEMRQNMEELQATQEESARKSAEMQSFIEALNNSCYVIEYDPQGYITSINDSFVELLGMRRSEIIGLHHSDKLCMDESAQKGYDQFWGDLINGLTKKQTNRFNVNGNEFVFQETYTPIKNEYGDVYKILKISNIITSSTGNKKKA